MLSSWFVENLVVFGHRRKAVTELDESCGNNHFYTVKNVFSTKSVRRYCIVIAKNHTITSVFHCCAGPA